MRVRGGSLVGTEGGCGLRRGAHLEHQGGGAEEEEEGKGCEEGDEGDVRGEGGGGEGGEQSAEAPGEVEAGEGGTAANGVAGAAEDVDGGDASTGAEAAYKQACESDGEAGGEGEGAEACEGGEKADEERAREAGGDGDAADGGTCELGEGEEAGVGVSEVPVAAEEREDGAEEDSRKTGEHVGDVHERERGCGFSGGCGLRLAEWLRREIVNLHAGHYRRLGDSPVR